MKVIIILSIIVGGIIYTVLNDDTVNIKDIPGMIAGCPKAIKHMFTLF